MKNSCLTVVLAMLMAFPLAAQAYIGPGAGLSALGSLLALVFTLVVAVLGFFWYPLYRLIKRRRGGAEADEALETEQQERPQ